MNRNQVAQVVKDQANAPQEAVAWAEFSRVKPGGRFGEFDGHFGSFVMSNGQSGVAMADQDGNVVVEFD